MLLHASCVARRADAVLFLGPPGAGKSDLALRLIREDWALVADDQVCLEVVAGVLHAAAPDALRGRLEVRGIGLFAGLPVAAPPTLLRLVVQLEDRAAVPRLPQPRPWRLAELEVPAVALHAFDASAPAKVALALEAATGRALQTAGAFVP
jgi:HPr kinase/phosphorylase